MANENVAPLSSKELLELELLRLKQELVEVELAEQQYLDSNKIEFFRPLPHQAEALKALRDGKKIVVLQGANRIGKTTFVAVFLAASCLGYEPWSGEKSVFDGKPIRARVIGVDWEHHVKEVLVPKFIEWFPKGTYRTKKNNIGADYFWQFTNGSTVEIMVHGQNTREHEGWSGHLIIFDEPPPRDKYIANMRGLVDTGGRCVMAFTAVYENWILDEIVRSQNPNVAAIVEVPMTANPYLKHEDIETFSSSIDDVERKARVEGKWLQLQGLVLPEFKPDVHIVKPFQIPLDYPVCAMIDLHLSEKQAVGFYAVSPNNIVFAIDEIWQNATPEDLADMIKRKKRENKWRLEKAYIDPLSKGDKDYLKNRAVVRDSFSIISDSLRQEGILLYVASKDKLSGIRNVKSMLRGVNGIPTLYFFDTCQRHIFEIQRWVYDPKTGLPVDKNDHFCENLYRLTLSDFRYVSPTVWTESLSQYYDKPIV